MVLALAARLLRVLVAQLASAGGTSGAGRPGTAVIQEPTTRAPESGSESYRRIVRWFMKADVSIRRPEEV
jgi:hypothetical protein